MISRILLISAAIGVLTACSPLRWSGHPTRISGFTGVQPDPARPLAAPSKEPTPFISRIPLTREELSVASHRYRAEADRYRKEASSHQTMKELYSVKDPVMADHCASLALQLSALADQCEVIGNELQNKADALMLDGN